jgi:CelD/BcsL family acetyltransferase involved in cellulose biosynthesis
VRVAIVDDLASLEREWGSVFMRDPAATPFASFEWLSAWYARWSAGGRPWILVVYDGANVVGLAPFLRQERGGMRYLTGLGVGVGNYWDIVAPPADRSRVVAAVADALRKRSMEWDAFFVDKLPEESNTVAAMREAGLRLGPPTRSASPRIELPDAFDDYLARLSKNRRWRLRRSLKTIDSGQLTVRPVSDSAGLPATLERWQALRVQWWRERGGEMLEEHGSARFLAFTQDAVAALVESDMAVVWEVLSGEELVGVTVNFMDQGTFYYWLWGFDPCIEELKPGHTLLAYSIRWSIETGRRYFDFMVGDEAYKYDYAPEDHGVLTMTIGNHRLRSRATLGLASLRRTMLPEGMRIPIFGRSV